MKRGLVLLAPIAFVALLLGAWQAACVLLHTPSYYLPTPLAIAAALVSHAGSLFSAAWVTLSTALAAFLIVGVIANLAALAASTGEVVESGFRPVAVMLQVTPIMALAPLFTIWAGVEHPDRAVIGLACVAGFFPIYSGALAGLRSADPELERLFDLYGASGWQRLTRLRIPSAIPLAMEGYKVGLGLALVGAVVGEMMAGGGGEEGLAWRILEASHLMQMDRSFAAVAALGLIAGALHLGYQALERRALAWWRGR
jgi:NitT/TauT family transport system permease protein